MKKHSFNILISLLAASLLAVSCGRDKQPVVEGPVDFFKPLPIMQKNALDSLVDTIYMKYNVRVIYRFEPRVIDPTTFFTPADYDRAKGYVKTIVEQVWLEPLSKSFPEFFSKEAPIEFLAIGSPISFNHITQGGSVGAGLNAQFYRLGMGGVDGFSRTRAWVKDHIAILYHEHAHQLDHKFGRPVGYDAVSQGEYYANAYGSITDAQAQLDGFFRAYGGYAREEDFATTVEACIRYPKATIETIIAKNTKLAKKYKMVYDFYKSRGLDLHEMQGIIDNTVNQLIP